MGMPMEDVPLTLCRSPAQRREVSLVDVLKIRLKVQPMLPKHIAVQMLLESNHDHSRLNLFDAEGFTGRYLSGLDIGVHNELLLGLAVGVSEAVKALVGHTHKLGMLLLFLLIVGLGLIFPGGQLRGRSPLVTLGPRGYPKDFGAA